jgi:hypothetical protein
MIPARKAITSSASKIAAIQDSAWPNGPPLCRKECPVIAERTGIDMGRRLNRVNPAVAGGGYRLR